MLWEKWGKDCTPLILECYELCSPSGVFYLLWWQKSMGFHGVGVDQGSFWIRWIPGLLIFPNVLYKFTLVLKMMWAIFLSYSIITLWKFKNSSKESKGKLTSNTYFIMLWRMCLLLFVLQIWWKIWITFFKFKSWRMFLLAKNLSLEKILQ